VKGARELLFGLVPGALLASGLAWAATDPRWAPPDAFASPWTFAGFLMLATAAALHRPGGGGLLGLGTLALPPAFALVGAVATALVALVAALLAELLRRLLEQLLRDAPLPERRQLGRVLAQSALAGLGALAAGGVWVGLGEATAAGRELSWAAALSGVLFLLPVTAHELAARRWQRGESRMEILRGVARLAGELPGFAIGGLAVAVAASAGWGLAAAWLAVAALLAFEIGRREVGADAVRRGLAEAARISRAGASLVATGSELARLARRIFAECAEIVPYTFVLLEMESPESGPVRFWATPDGEPREGEPDPPAYPPPLPGFHRREAWRILEHRLLAEGERRARLRLWCDPRRLAPAIESSLAALLPQMAATLRAALADREATTDRLTGTGSRRALERRLTDAFAAARGEGRPLAVVIADLDHFKRINDTHGHAAGDRALVAVARVLLGARDFCARFGGEEFVLVLEETSGAAALEIAERLRRRIEELPIGPEGTPVELTMSFGVAAFPELPVRSPEELLELADGALYAAKRLGRNLALLDLGGGRMRTGLGGVVEIDEPAPARAPVFFA
jgi:diguanylate cyclase (GGDEF)-like protein